mgnify:CR=1 FL=1
MDGDRLYFKTTLAAPRGRVIAVDPAAPTPVEIVPEAKSTLYQASLVAGHVIAELPRGRALARRRCSTATASGCMTSACRALGTAIGFPDSAQDSETFFAYTDYLTPAARCIATTSRRDEVTTYRKPRSASIGSPYVTEQVFYASKDGTRVPMFITRRKDSKLDGRNADAALRLRRLRHRR